MFNFASSNNYTSIWTESSQLDSYISNILYPILDGIAGFPSLAIIELSNEPEGSTAGIPWAGWQSHEMTITSLQRSTNVLAAAIHTHTPRMLVTQGSWSLIVSTDLPVWNFTNIYRDDRLIAAGGHPTGVLDLQQIHYYGGSPPSPFNFTRADLFSLDKPLIVGEFSSSGIFNDPIQQLYNALCEGGYDGALGWQANGTGEDSDSLETLMIGVASMSAHCQTGKSARPDGAPAIAQS